MLSGSKIEGGTQNISPGLRMTIETLKEVAKGHSEEDIYATLKESNMDPNETFQKLSHQDTFHEVRRRRDRKKEAVNEPSEHIESTGPKIQEDRKEFESANVNLKPKAYLHRNIRRGPYRRNPLSGTRVNREFRVVKDKRINHDTDKDTLDPAVSEPAMPASLASSKGSSNNKVTGGDDPHANATANNGNLQTGAMKQNVSKPRSTTSSNNSVLGVYSSSTDPVHVPSHGSRSATNVGAIKRDVGVVGARRQSTEANNKPSSSQGGLSSNYHTGQHRPPSRGNPRSFGSFSKSDQNAASVPSSHPNGRSFSSYQHNPRPNQSVVHQKSAQPSKEWKPKVSQKLVADASEPYEEKPGKSAAPASSRPDHLEEETSKLPDKVSRVNISENVIIAPHLRVESEKYHLTFGCLDAGSIPSKTSAEEQNVERSVSLFVSVSDRLVEEPGAENNQLVLSKDVPQSSGSSSPLPGSISVPPQIDKKESSVLSELVNYSDLGLVREAATSFEPQRQPDASDLSSFSVYDPQTGYDLTYFRPNTADEAVRGHDLLSSQEVLISHTGNSIPSSSIGMVPQVQQQPQQQQQAVAQMYPQVHLPHFTSIMPYRQFISPVYVPPMAVQGYSGNPAFSHHPSNGSSYVLMPGATSHLSASGGLKYGMQQYKPVPTGTQTGFGSFTSPTGYAMNAPGVIGNATGLDDSARLKFKDANLYVPNPQAETSEIWMNAREVVPNMQTASYFNMPAGQAPHAGPAAYMTSPHGGHPSFNAAAAVAQSSHMQFPMYHHQPPQPAMIGNPHHHMGGGAVGGNVGVGIAAAAAAAANPGGAYQQPQLGHLNWTAGNF